MIDAIDECTDLQFISSLIQLILESLSAIPFKVLIAIRDKPLINCAFTFLLRVFYLHEADKDLVKDDIQMYLETLLAKIKADHDRTILDNWPPHS